MQVHTCPPALGFSFAAGTTDGPGALDFVQGQLLIRSIIIMQIPMGQV